MLILKPLIMLRNYFSLHVYRRYKNQFTDLEPDLPISISRLADHCYGHLEWKEDPINGLMDHIQPIKHMNWQLKTNGMIEGDCDDLATWIGWMLKRMGIKHVKRVNIVKYKHVICVFFDPKHEKWRYFSNASLKTGMFKSTRQCVDAWCERKKHKPTRWFYTENM